MARKFQLPAEGQLLSREAFKTAVFARAGGTCVFCSRPAVDPHHILERKLFPDGGYYLGNGAAVCDEHHWECETTALSVEQVRQAAGIREAVLPPGFARDVVYDKWGNQVLEGGVRVAGLMAADDGMRKALQQGGYLHLLLASGSLTSFG